ncbi:MAG: MATE family efflux transporter [Sphaerochaetaceae bacterium]|nr:MATE family efflux transporter [Sphaerochaetaceae bacterium]
MKRKSLLFGDRKFYSQVLAIALPIMAQNAITSFVSLLDNLMVGRMGTEPMAGVSIVNQLFFVFNIIIFGVMSGPGLYTSQYFGQNDHEGIRNTVRYKLLIGSIVTILSLLALIFFGDKLVGFYLNESDSSGDLALTLEYAMSYLKIIAISLPIFLVIQAYSYTLRECGETLAPMKAGSIAVVVNLFLDWVLIFGKLGFPELGVQGAAIATLIARVVEGAYVVVYTHKNNKRFSYVKGLYKSIKVPKKLAFSMLKTSLPLLFNESMWVFGMSFLLQCYSTRGLDVVAGYNIANTLVHLFEVAFIAMGNTVGIMVGRLLGANKMDEALDVARKDITFSVLCSLVLGLIACCTAPFFPRLYNTSSEAKAFATSFILVTALFMPSNAYKNASYFVIRSGGKTLLTLLMDGLFVWYVNVPVAFFLSRFTSVGAVSILLAVQISDLIKVVIGFILVEKKVWMRNITV